MIGNRHQPSPLVTVARSPVPRAIPTVLPPWELQNEPLSPSQPSLDAAACAAEHSTTSRGSKFSLLTLDSSLSLSSTASQASSNASSRASSKSSSRGSSKGRSVRALTAAGALAGAVAGCIMKKPRRWRSGSRGGHATPASDTEDVEFDIPREFTEGESPHERICKRRVAMGRTKEDPMESFRADDDWDEAWCCPAETWCIVLSFVDTSDICHFACADCTFYGCAMGYAGADFSHPGWLRDRRTAVQERWARARAILLQVQVVRGMRSATPNGTGGSVRRCPRLQRLNRHRR